MRHSARAMLALSFALVGACGGGGGSKVAPDSGTSDSPDIDGGRQGEQPDGGDTSDDAGAADDAGDGTSATPPCPGDQVRCNDECMSLGSGEAKGCSVWATLAGTTGSAIIAPDGALFASVYEDVSSLHRVAPGGGASKRLSNERMNVEQLVLEDDAIYFTTSGESSDIRPRMTGSIGRVALPDGKPEILFSDLADGTMAKTATNFYVGANQIDTGLRRYELDGSGETLLTDRTTDRVFVAGDTLYLIEDAFFGRTIDKMPLAGGDISAFADGNCFNFLGSDDTHIYADCTGVVRFDRATGEAEVLVNEDEWDSRPLRPLLLAGDYVYYYEEGALDDSPKALDDDYYSVNRVSKTGETELLAEINDPNREPSAVAIHGQDMYVVMSGYFELGSVVLKIALP